jgi:hypothetical protein
VEGVGMKSIGETIDKSAKNPVFEILIDSGLAEIINNPVVKISHESVLSLLNDYEDNSWRYEIFQNFISNNISETALSQQERLSLIGEPATLLSQAAKNLRLTDSDKDTSKGSEIAEILLYGILKMHYKSLPIVPKIFYKQNTNDFAKGADSVHIVLNDDQTDFSLWFGESKFYTKLDDAHLSKAVNSVREILQAGKIKKENRIITGLRDFELYIKDEKLREQIINLLSESTSLDLLRPKLHIPILLLYECEITAKHNEKSIEYRKEIKKCHEKSASKYYIKQIKTLSDSPKYNDIHFHLIIFPVPNKQKIVEMFTSRAKVLRGDS